jgi:hypothetical protein
MNRTGWPPLVTANATAGTHAERLTSVDTCAAMEEAEGDNERQQDGHQSSH